MSRARWLQSNYHFPRSSLKNPHAFNFRALFTFQIPRSVNCTMLTCQLVITHATLIEKRCSSKMDVEGKVLLRKGRIAHHFRWDRNSNHSFKNAFVFQSILDTSSSESESSSPSNGGWSECDYKINGETVRVSFFSSKNALEYSWVDT